MLPDYHDLRCPGCGWCEVCGPESVIRWLRQANKVRFGREPEPEILGELFRATAGQLKCPRCGHFGLTASRAPDDDLDWPGEVPCAVCGKPIPAERLQAIPSAKLCAACQNHEETGGSTGEPEFCPRCGSRMALRLSKSTGITRYTMSCTATPPCRL